MRPGRGERKKRKKKQTHQEGKQKTRERENRNSSSTAPLFHLVALLGKNQEGERDDENGGALQPEVREVAPEEVGRPRCVCVCLSVCVCVCV